jgi:hypothetical protein
MTIYVPDVGDGLAAGVRTIDGTPIEIDCGSQNEAEAARHKGLHRIDPNVFFLSHFHLDHYNGLVQPNSRRPWPWPTIRQAYYPRIPVFPERETFLRCMLAMAHWLLGDTSGSMAADFLSVLSGINYTSFTYRSISMGDTVSVGGSHYEVLWPPKILDEKGTLKVISRAIKDFHAATEEDESLRRLLERIDERGEMRPYMSAEGETGELPGKEKRAGLRDECPYPLRERHLPAVIQKANKSLRKAANHLSLAFHEDNKFLFMGDIEASEIRQVINMLARKDRDRFFAMIAPHHGTHWHKDLRKIHSYFTISSVGSGLFPHLRTDYRLMSDICLITHLNGDVEVPVFFPPWYGMRSWRYWHKFL